MSNYKIEKDVPFPDHARGLIQNGLKDVYPISDMDVGHSFVINEDYDNKSANRVRGRLHVLKKRLKLEKRTYVVNKDPKSKKIRIWRLK